LLRVKVDDLSLHSILKEHSIKGK